MKRFKMLEGRKIWDNRTSTYGTVHRAVEGDNFMYFTINLPNNGRVLRRDNEISLPGPRTRYYCRHERVYKYI